MPRASIVGSLSLRSFLFVLVMGGAMASGRAAWGSVRKLPSGRYQARYRLDGKMVGAPSTFRTKRDAEAYLSTVRADMERGQWVNPVAGKTTLREYSTKWLEQRPGPAAAHG